MVAKVESGAREYGFVPSEAMNWFNWYSKRILWPRRSTQRSFILIEMTNLNPRENNNTNMLLWKCVTYSSKWGGVGSYQFRISSLFGHSDVFLFNELHKSHFLRGTGGIYRSGHETVHQMSFGSGRKILFTVNLINWIKSIS